jgi:CXXC-20-CXXC protein
MQTCTNCQRAFSYSEIWKSHWKFKGRLTCLSCEQKYKLTTLTNGLWIVLGVCIGYFGPSTIENIWPDAPWYLVLLSFVLLLLAAVSLMSLVARYKPVEPMKNVSTFEEEGL